MHWLAYRFSQLLLTLIFSLLGKVRVLRARNGAMRGAFILAANHISHFDPPVITVATRRKIDWMGMKELFSHPLAAAYFRAVDTFPTDRENVDRTSVKTALQRLKRGHVLGLFPEGGIRAGATSVLEGAPILPGAGAIAQMAGVPVLPCVVLGSDRLYNKRRWRIFGAARFYVGFGGPIRPPTGMNKADARAWIERELTAAFRSLVAEMRVHFSLTDDDLPKTPQQRREEA